MIDIRNVKTFSSTASEQDILISFLIDRGLDRHEAAAVVYDAYDLGFQRALEYVFGEADN